MNATVVSWAAPKLEAANTMLKDDNNEEKGNTIDYRILYRSIDANGDEEKKGDNNEWNQTKNLGNVTKYDVSGIVSSSKFEIKIQYTLNNVLQSKPSESFNIVFAKWSTQHKGNTIQLSANDTHAILTGDNQSVRATNPITKGMMVRLRFTFHAPKNVGRDMFGLISSEYSGHYNKNAMLNYQMAKYFYGLCSFSSLKQLINQNENDIIELKQRNTTIEQMIKGKRGEIIQEIENYQKIQEKGEFYIDLDMISKFQQFLYKHGFQSLKQVKKKIIELREKSETICPEEQQEAKNNNFKIDNLNKINEEIKKCIEMEYELKPLSSDKNSHYYGKRVVDLRWTAGAIPRGKDVVIDMVVDYRTDACCLTYYVNGQRKGPSNRDYSMELPALTGDHVWYPMVGFEYVYNMCLINIVGM